MPTVTVYTAERMKEIEDASIVNVKLVDGNVILTRFDSTEVNVGPLDAAPPTVSGSRGGNAALASLLTALASQNVIVDNTTV